VIVTENEKYKYLGPKSDHSFPNTKDVETWLHDYLNGKLEQFLLSEPIPAVKVTDGVIT